MKLLCKLQIHLSKNLIFYTEKHKSKSILKHTKLNSYDLYLLSPKEPVLNLSMNLNSSLLNCCGDTFFTTEMLNVSNEKFSMWHSFACIDRADFSTLSSLLKQDLCPLVRLWQCCIVRPKYVSLHNLQFHM